MKLAGYLNPSMTRTGLKRRQIGATSLEWAILSAFIAVMVVVSIASVGTNLAGLFSRAYDCFVQLQC